MNVEQNVSVFGIAEKPYIFFQCQISLLSSKTEQCPKPTCSDSHRKRFVAFTDIINKIPSSKKKKFDIVQ